MSIYAKRGLVIRLIYTTVAILWFIITLLGRHNRRIAVTLCYHGVISQQGDSFRNQMIRLKSFLDKKSLLYDKQINNHPVVLTFDDAFSNLIENAIPILQETGISALIFAVSGNLGQTPQWNIASGHPEYNEKIMTTQQLKDIQSDLIKIGSHTQTHPDLSKLSPEQVRWELIESKKNLEQILDKAVEDLGLPHGAYNQEVLRIARDVGYKRIYTLEPKLADNQEAGVLGRFSMSPDVWPIEFYLTCAGAYQWLGPWRRMVRSMRKWFYYISFGSSL